MKKVIMTYDFNSLLKKARNEECPMKKQEIIDEMFKVDREYTALFNSNPDMHFIRLRELKAFSKENKKRLMELGQMFGKGEYDLFILGDPDKFSWSIKLGIFAKDIRHFVHLKTNGTDVMSDVDRALNRCRGKKKEVYSSRELREIADQQYLSYENESNLNLFFKINEDHVYETYVFGSRWNNP